MTATTTISKLTGAMCSGAPGLWSPFAGVPGTGHRGDANASAVVGSGATALR